MPGPQVADRASFCSVQHGEAMAFLHNLLTRDRLYWALLTVVYAVGSGAVIVGAGPISWELRAETGWTAGSAGTVIGLLAGSAAFVAILSVLSARRAAGRLVLPINAVFASIALGLAIRLLPSWGIVSASIASAVFVLAVVASVYVRRKQQEAEAARSKGKRRFVDLDLESRGEKPDWPILAGSAVLAFSVGVLGSVSMSTMSSAFAPALPGTVGTAVAVGDGDVNVEIMYAVNNPHAVALLGDGQLRSLVEDGVVTLGLRGVATESDASMAVPELMGEACAAEVGGVEGWADYVFAYNEAAAAADMGTTFEDILSSAVESEESGALATCMTSGKYEHSAAAAVAESLDVADRTLPEIHINGEQVKPETVDDLITLINEQ